MTTLTVSPQRERMLQLLDAGRSYEFLATADPYLEASPEDHYIRLMAIREYLKLGLITPARDLLEADIPAGELPSEFAPIRESLAAVSGAAVPWSRHRRRFDANLTALSDRGIDVTLIRDAWSLRHGEFQLFRDTRGVEQVRVRDTDRRWRWMPALADHRVLAESQPMPQDIGANMPGPYLFEGLGLGWYFQRVYRATRDTFLGYSCALFVVEPDPAAFALVLHLHDWRELLWDPRVLVFVGDGCMERLTRAWMDNSDLPFPRHVFTLGRTRRAAAPSAVDIVRGAAEARQSAIKESLKDLEERYSARDGRYWAKRFDDALRGRGDPLRILGAVSTHTTFLQYSMRDAKRAFEALGHQCRVLTDNAPHEMIGPLTYHNAIRDFDPDLFFSIDHLRPEFEPILPANLPVLTWDQDQLPHVFTRANMERIGRLDFVVGWSKARCVAAGCNPKQLLYARIPTSPEQFGGEPLTDEERRRYTCDVSYVSHASQTPQAFHEQERALYEDSRLKSLLDTMYEMAPAMLARHTVMGGAPASLILDEASRRCRLAIRDEELRTRLTGWYLWRLGDRIFRHQALEWVAAWARSTGRTFRIYGNGWEGHPTLSDFAAGPAHNGRELLCIYRASAVNLQLMPAGFIHQRSLDGLAAGGFFLSRATPTDLRGNVLRRLDARIRELGISTTDALLQSDDEVLRPLLRDYLGEWLERVDPKTNDTVSDIRITAELLHPEEVFPRFREVLFDSALEFEEKAERFLSDESGRRAIANEMRDVVIEHFSYRPMMDRFLRAMATYLSETFA